MQSPFRVHDKLVTVVTDTPTITAGAYSANDVVGGLITFTRATHHEYVGGVVQSITIIDDASQKAELELHLFDQAFTPTADNAAFDPTDDDLENYIGYVLVTTADYKTFTDNAAASVSNIGLAFNLADDGTSLFGQLVTRSGPTYAATDDLTIKLAILQD